MHLHENPEAFVEFTAAAAESIGLPEIYVEKDYWVTKSLKQLADSPYAPQAVFKGGTSLSKAHRLIERFSEDIDIAIFSENVSDASRKKLMKNIETASAHGLVSLSGDQRESKGSKFRRTVYQYPRFIEGPDFGQVSPQILIEVNAFTHPEPHEQRELKTLIADVLQARDRNDLIETFGLESFPINVLSIQRTLIEKILGIIKDSYHEDPIAKLSNRIRHLYDICMILKQPACREFVQSNEFQALFQKCLADETILFPAQAGMFDKPILEAPVFHQFEAWLPSLKTTYTTVFADLVHGELPSLEEIKEALLFIKEHL